LAVSRSQPSILNRIFGRQTGCWFIR